MWQEGERMTKSHRGKRRADTLAKLREASRRSTLDLDAAAFIKALSGESDRGAIILGATMIDDRLWHRLNEIASSSKDLASGFHRRMDRSFASRVELAQELGMIAPGTADMIEVIREMRNACAHGREKLVFRSPLILEAINLLLAPSSTSLRSCTPALRRDVFVVVCAYLAMAVSGRTSRQELAKITPILESVGAQVAGCD